MAEPFSVFGAGRHSPRLDGYLGRSLVGQATISVCLAAAAGLAAAVLSHFNQPALSSAFLGMALAAPFYFGRIFVRQPLYITGRVHWSAVTGALYLIFSVSCLILIRRMGSVTPFLSFIALGFSSLLIILAVVLLLLKPIWRGSDPALSVRRLTSDHIHYGKWAVGERLLLWMQTNVFFIVLPVIADLHTVAVFRVAGVLAMPATMTMTAAAGVILPDLVKLNESGQRTALGRVLLCGALAITLVYGVLLVTFGKQAAHIAFAGRYDHDLTVTLIAAIGLGPIIAGVCLVLELQLRARLMVRRVLAARSVATLVLLVAGPALMWYFGVLGAAISVALTWGATALALLAQDRWLPSAGHSSPPTISDYHGRLNPVLGRWRARD